MRWDAARWVKALAAGVGTLAMVLAISDGLGLAGAIRSDSQVKVSATSTKPDQSGNQTVTVQLDISKDWYIYANPIRNSDFLPNQTKVEVKGKVPPADVKVVYPAGKLKQDKDVGDYMIWENKVTIQAKVQRAEGDTGPLELNVKFNACNKKGTCLAPANVKVTIP
jgi:thiol:disulfide interchange protein